MSRKLYGESLLNRPGRLRTTHPLYMTEHSEAAVMSGDGVSYRYNFNRARAA